MSQPITPGQPSRPQGQPQQVPPGQYPPAGPQPPYQQPQPQQPQPQQPQPQQQPYPQQQYPQPGYGGQPASGQQAGYAQQPAQPGYPPQGYPPQGYPQAQGYAPQGYPPAGGPHPPAGKSPKNLIMIVIGVVALLAIAGGVFLAMSGNRTEPETPVTPAPVPTTPAPEPSPDQPTTPAPGPSPDQPTTPAPQPSPDQPTTPAPPSGSSIQLGSGVVIPVAQGWQAEQKSPTAAVFSDGKAQVVAQVVTTEKTADPGQVCVQFHQGMLKDAPNTKFGEPRPVNAPDVVKIASCMAMYTETQGGQSADVLVETFVSVRTTDASTVLYTIFSTDATPESSFTGVNEMLNAALNSHIASA